jgi:DNA replication protein DnaC
VALALAWPTWGPAQLSNQLRCPEYGDLRVAPSTIYRLLGPRGLQTPWQQRLAVPEALSAQGGEGRIRAAHFPACKTVEEFDFSYQVSLRQQVVLHLATLSFIEARENVIFLGPPGTGKTHIAVAPGIKACLAGHRAQFATAT